MYPRSIPIPAEHLDAFRHLHHAKRFAIDIGKYTAEKKAKTNNRVGVVIQTLSRIRTTVGLLFVPIKE
jgi:hypothetical protein